MNIASLISSVKEPSTVLWENLDKGSGTDSEASSRKWRHMRINLHSKPGYVPWPEKPIGTQQTALGAVMEEGRLLWEVTRVQGKLPRVNLRSARTLISYS